MPSEQEIFIRICNHVHELEKKNSSLNDSSLLRIINRMRDTLTEAGYHTLNPMGETYSVTRTDCYATISGDETDHLVITDVLKPIVWYRNNGTNQIVQKAVVIVEKK
jgi:hypothetical protein